MKRFIAVLSGILVLPAFAEVAPVYYDEIVEYTDDMLNDEFVAEEAPTAQQKAVAQRNTINRSTSASRAVSAATNSGSSRTSTTTRAMASSARTSANKARTTTSRAARTSSVVNRPSATASSRASVRARGAQNTTPVTARVGVNAANAVIPATSKALSTNQTSVVEDSGQPLYNSNTTARVSMQTGTNRGKTVRLSTATLSSSTTPVVTETDVSSTTSNLNAIAELTDYCKAQYAACMDNYCNVLDDNQGRCSCSKNLKNYEKTEDALTTATEQFQEAIQKIRYIGLTGPQIEALFAETEAELAMKDNTDSSQLKSSLDAIKRKVVEVSSPTSASSSVTSGLSLDLNGLLNADFTAGFDLNSFLNTSNNTNTTSVSNQRGEQLYKTATARCKTAVLNSCTAQGIDANVIANSYDLEIDKQCIAYERALTDANKEMKNNVFNATNILQQARLLLAQNKNSYDLRGCVAAIDSCMQDEYVCGSDYELCLDPTGKYLANGEIVKGGTPGISGGQNKTTTELTQSNLTTWTSGGMYDLYATWNYEGKVGNETKDKNAWGKGAKENLGEYIDVAMTDWKDNYTKSTLDSDNVALYLLQKIGYIDADDKVHGMCASVMKQCQDYTFETAKNKTAKNYRPDNEVVRQYLNSTLAKIKAQQDAILADYAEGCSGDVQSCLSSNGYDSSNTTSTASRTAVSACASEITTCMSVSGYTPKDGIGLTLRAMNDWVASILISCPVNTYLDDNGTSVSCTACPQFGSLKTESLGGQVTRCSCPEGYDDVLEAESTSSGTPTGRQRLAGCSVDGQPYCATNFYLKDGQCTACPEAPLYSKLLNQQTNVVAWVALYKPNTNPAVQSTVATTSAGGSVTACNCPSPYTPWYLDSSGNTTSNQTPENLVCYKVFGQ